MPPLPPKLLPILIRSIPHDQQRYDTVGDWHFPTVEDLIKYLQTLDPKSEAMLISVSGLGNADYEYLCGVHELVEGYLCRRDGLTDEMVTAYDIQSKDGEPGDNPFAPYHAQHMIGTLVERVLASPLKIVWQDYDESFSKLGGPEHD